MGRGLELAARNHGRRGRVDRPGAALVPGRQGEEPLAAALPGRGPEMPGAPLRVQPAEHGKVRSDLPHCLHAVCDDCVCHSAGTTSRPAARASAGSGTSAIRTTTRTRRAIGAARSGAPPTTGRTCRKRSRPWSSRRSRSGASSSAAASRRGERLVPADDVRARGPRALPDDAVLAQGVTPCCSRARARSGRGSRRTPTAGRTRRFAGPPRVVPQLFGARRRPGRRRASAPPDSLEEYRAAVGEYPLERGRLRGPTHPAARELCARALPIGTEIPADSMQTDNGNEDKVVTKVETYHRTYNDGGSILLRAGAGPGPPSRRKRPRTPPRRSPGPRKADDDSGVVNGQRHRPGPPPPATPPRRRAPSAARGRRPRAPSD